MCRTATIRALGAVCFSLRSRGEWTWARLKRTAFCGLSRTALLLWAVFAAATQLAWAQATAVEWRHIGNSAIDLALPSVATGAVDRVWYSENGSSLYARTASGRIFETSDFENWKRALDGKIIHTPHG